MSLVIPVYTHEFPSPLGQSRNQSVHSLHSTRARVGKAIIDVLQADSAYVDTLNLVNANVSAPGSISVDIVQESTPGHGVVFSSDVAAPSIVTDTIEMGLSGTSDVALSRIAASAMHVEAIPPGPATFGVNAVTANNLSADTPLADVQVGSNLAFVAGCEERFTNLVPNSIVRELELIFSPQPSYRQLADGSQLYGSGLAALDTRVTRSGPSSIGIDNGTPGGPAQLVVDSISLGNTNTFAGLLNHYQEATPVLTLGTIFAAGVTVTARLVRVGSAVSMFIQSKTNATTGAGTGVITVTPALAADFRPAQEVMASCIVVNAGADQLGRIRISNAGVITVEATAAGGSFSNAAVVSDGFQGISVSWNVLA